MIILWKTKKPFSSLLTREWFSSFSVTDVFSKVQNSGRFPTVKLI